MRRCRREIVDMDYQKAAAYWTDRQDGPGRMDPKEALAEAEAYLRSRTTCALATADLDGFVRCTPIEYTYEDGALCMMSEGGLKFRALERNKNVSVSVFDQFEGWATLSGVQIQGVADVIEPWSEEYLAYLGRRGIPESRLRGLSTEINLIRVRPTSMDVLLAGLKSRGFDSRQHLEL